MKVIDECIEPLKRLIKLNPESEGMLRFDVNLLEIIEQPAKTGAFVCLAAGER